MWNNIQCLAKNVSFGQYCKKKNNRNFWKHIKCRVSLIIRKKAWNNLHFYRTWVRVGFLTVSIICEHANGVIYKRKDCKPMFISVLKNHFIWSKNYAQVDILENFQRGLLYKLVKFKFLIQKGILFS